jgi:hypothetical protein
VVRLGRTLDAVGLPLSAEQSRPLTAVYVAEQARQREEMQRVMSSMHQAGLEDQPWVMEERFRLQAESNRRLVSAARSTLNPEQVEALQASLESELAMNRASNRMQQQQAAQPAITGVSTMEPAPVVAPIVVPAVPSQ